MSAREPLEVARVVQEAAARKGFDWPDISGVLAKVREEIGEVEQALASGDLEHARHELGDLLFAAVNLARFLDKSPSAALREATEKFSNRFRRVEQLFEQRNVNMEDCGIEELDAVWELVKHHVDRAENGGLDI